MANAGAIWLWAQSLTDASGAAHPMAGLLGVETSFAKRRMTLGYREARIAANWALGRGRAVLRGHEFHYATIVDDGGDDPFAFVRDVYGSAGNALGLPTGPGHRLVLSCDRQGVSRGGSQRARGRNRRVAVHRLTAA